MTKIAYVFTHPQTGGQVLAMPGETPVQALARFNTVLGFDPADYMPTLLSFPWNPRWTPLYTPQQLQGMMGYVSVLNDPDTWEQIPVAEYIANLQRYITERDTPLPQEAWTIT